MACPIEWLAPTVPRSPKEGRTSLPKKSTAPDGRAKVARRFIEVLAPVLSFALRLRHAPLTVGIASTLRASLSAHAPLTVGIASTLWPALRVAADRARSGAWSIWCGMREKRF